MRDNLPLSVSPRAYRGSGWSRWSTGAVLLVEAWLSRRRQRRNLLELGDHMLKDIGLTRSEAYREGSKPFWRP